MNQLVTHLCRRDVAGQYGHILRINKLTPADLYTELQRVRGTQPFPVTTTTAYAPQRSNPTQLQYYGPRLAWELLNGSGLVYGTRDERFKAKVRIAIAGKAIVGQTVDQDFFEKTSGELFAAAVAPVNGGAAREVDRQVITFPQTRLTATANTSNSVTSRRRCASGHRG